MFGLKTTKPAHMESKFNTNDYVLQRRSQHVRRPGGQGMDTLIARVVNEEAFLTSFQLWQAREIMVLASRTSVSSPPSALAVQKPGYHVSDNAARVPVPEPRHVSVISSPIPAVSQAPTISKRIPGYQNYTPAPTTSSGVPSSVVPPPSQASSAQRMQQASPAVAAAIKLIGMYYYKL